MHVNGGRIRRFQAEGTVGGNFIIGAESVRDWTKASVAKSIAGKEGAGAWGYGHINIGLLPRSSDINFNYHCLRVAILIINNC